MRRWILGSLVFPAALLLADRPALACSCIGGLPICQTFWETDVVFAGEVIDISRAETPAPPPIMGNRLVRFRVERTWRGNAFGTIEVRTGNGGGDCGYSFQRGSKYLVYARRFQGVLTTSICSRTKPLADAAEDLAYFETAFKPSVAGTVFGRAQRQGDGTAVRPIVGYTVTLVGEGKRWETATGPDGRYEFKAIPVGKYTTTLHVPEGEHVYGSREARLVDPRGCAAADFYVVADGRIALRVLDPRGQPVTGLSIDVVRLDTITADRFPDSRSIRTDADGRGEVGQLRPDRYVIALNLTRAPDAAQPYPTLYFPGVRELSDAQVIDLNLGERVDMETFTLPAALDTQVITGTVVWPDGTPAVGAGVILRPAGPSIARGLTTANTTAGKDGRFSISAPTGLRYSLLAYSARDDRTVQWNTTSPDFMLGVSAATVTLTLAPPRPPR